MGYDATRAGPDAAGLAITVCGVSRNDELERYRAALRRQLVREFVERWGVCERGHVLTDLNRDKQGRCWCCTRAHERAFATSEKRRRVGESRSGAAEALRARSTLARN
jgi:hypothetical protein